MPTPLSRAVMFFGQDIFTDGDAYVYTGPAWWLGTSKQGGEWLSNAWHVASSWTNGAACLVIDIDRSILTNDLRMELEVLDHAGASLYLDLIDTNDVTVATNLHGNVMGGTDQTVTLTLAVPLSVHTNAATVQLRRGDGEITIYSCILFTDLDGDGLDAAQELQLGTSDEDADSDDDGLGDYAETFEHGTDAFAPDTDGDGVLDGWEIARGTDPAEASSAPERSVRVSAGQNHTLFVKPDGALLAWGNNGAGRLGIGTIGGTSTVPVPGATNLAGIAAVSAGEAHTLALLADRTVRAWGDGAYGKLGNDSTADSGVPVTVLGPDGDGQLTDVVAVSAGVNYSLALRADGTVWAWGNNSYGKLGDGTTDTSHTPVQVSGLSGVVAVSAGYRHSLALHVDGTVWAWGYNLYGRLGDGTTTTRTTPVQVTGLAGAVAISAGYRHSMALKSDGSAASWGYNLYGRLGDGTTSNSSVPVEVVDETGTNALSGITAISAGQPFCLALSSDGSLYAWGGNGLGQLAQNNVVGSAIPVKVMGESGVGLLEDVVAMDAGHDHAVVLRADGSVLTWGEGSYGRLGDGATTTRKTPVLVDTDQDGLRDDWEFVHFSDLGETASGDTDGDGLANSEEYVYGTDPADPDSDSDGMPDGWEAQYGLNPLDASDAADDDDDDGLTNLEEYQNGTSPKAGVDSLPPAARLSAGEQHSILVLDDGSVVAWGQNIDGRLGLGASGGQTAVVSRVAGIGGSNTLAETAVVSAGESHSLSVGTNGATLAWGNNYYGRLGNDSTTDRPYPDAVLGDLTNVVAVSAKLSHSLALKMDGTVWSWGNNQYGKLGDNTTTTRKTPIQVLGPGGTGFLTRMVAVSAGWNHSLAVRSDGTAWSWGYNAYGKLGDDTTTTRKTPIQVHGVGGAGFATNVVAVSAGYRHSLALAKDGTVLAWGYNESGRLGDGTTTTRKAPVEVTGLPSNIVAVAAGRTHSLALDSNGGVWAWGKNLNGELGIDSTVKSLTPVQVLAPDGTNVLSNIVAISAGWNHNLALAADGSLYAWGLNNKGQLGDGTTTKRLIPVLVDSDGDGLSDPWEMEHFDGLGQGAADDADSDGLGNAAEFAAGTDPNSTDTDGDGLSDSEEVSGGTDPLKADSDGDGWTDRYELDAGTDPLDPASAPAGPITLVIPQDAVVEAGGGTGTNELGSAWAAAEDAPVVVTQEDIEGTPWQGALVRLRLDEPWGLTAEDASGNGHDAAGRGAIPGASGPMGGAYDFTGKTSLSLGNPPALNFSGTITLSAWIMPRASNGLRNIISHGYRRSPNAETALRINSGRYEAMSWNGGHTRASAAIPAGDLNTWVHLAGVYDGSAWHLYRNGAEIASAAGPLGALEMDADWAIGATGTGTERFFSGLIDDAAIWQRALSQLEVSRLYEAGTRGEHRIEDITDRRWTATDASGASLSAVQVIVVQDTEVPALTVPADITIASSNRPVPVVTGEGTVTDAGSPGIEAAYADGESMMSEGLVLHLSLDEEAGASTAADASGAGNDGTVQSALSGKAGVLKGAFEFKGASCLKLGNPSSMNFSGTITMAAWVYSGYSNGIRDILGHGHRLNPHRETALRIANGSYEVLSWNGSPHKVSVPMTSGDLNTWVHLVGVYDGTTWRLYRNGVEVGATVDSVGALEMDADWAVGARGTGTERYFNGYMDEVAIWNRALSADEVTTLHTAGAEGRTFSPARTTGDSLTVLRSWSAMDAVGNVSRGDQVITVDGIDGDPDGDGLTSYDEYWLGTDPGNADTDGDGLSDGDELNVHGTDPFLSDTDGDGYRDGYETALGTDPLDGDSAPDAQMVFAMPADIAVEAGPGQTEPAVTGEPVAEANVLPLTVTREDAAYAFKDGNVMHLMLDGTNAASGAEDASLEGNDAAASGAPTNAAGIIGGAYGFDGASCLKLGRPDTMNFSGEITMAAWIKPRSSSGFRNIISHGYRLWPHREAVLRISSGDYEINSWNGSPHKVTVPMPSEDLNTWVHLAGTYDGTTWRLYRNGVEVGATVDSVGALEMDADWAVGARGNGAERFFNGLIDDAAVWDRALSAGEVELLHRLGSRGQTFLAPGETRTVLAMSRLWTAEDGLGETHSGEQTVWATDTTPPELSVPADIALSPGESASPAGAGQATAVDNWDPTPAVAFTDIDNAACEGLLLHLPLDEPEGESVAADASGSSHTGTLESVSSGQAGIVGSAFDFDGSGCIKLGNPSVLNFSGEITMSAWINPRTSSGLRNIISHGHRYSPDAETVLRINNGEYQVLSWDGSPHRASVGMPPSDIGAWVHLAGVYDGTTWRLYRNGTEVGSKEDPVGALEMDADWAIGARGTGTERFFDGLIDETGIWDRALSAEEVAHLYESGLAGLTYGAARSQGDPLTVTRTWTAVDGMLNATSSVQAITVSSPDSDSDGDGLSALREYLNGTDPGLADTDGDGLTDLAELDTHGSDPLDADTDGDTLGDGLEVNTLGSSPLLIDSDEDGLTDPDEYHTHGTDPAKRDTDGETLGDLEELETFGTDPLDTDSDDDGLLDAYLIEEKDGVDTSDREVRHFTHAWNREGTALYNFRSTGYYSLFYAFDVTNAAMHRIGIQLSNYRDFVPDGYRFKVAVAVDGTYAGTLEIAADLGASGVGYINTPWLAQGSHTVSLRWTNDSSSGGRDSNIMVEKVLLYGVDAPDADGDGIQDWMEDILDDGADTDGDGLSDHDEITVFGTSPLATDSDGDGLGDYAEVQTYGTDPSLTDSDGDGVTDGDEVYRALTDPASAEFDGTRTVLTTVAGSAAEGTLGTWETDGGTIYARDRRGHLDYTVGVAQTGHYALEVDVTQHHPLTRQDTFDLGIEIDGSPCGRQVVRAPHGTVATALYFLPELAAGNHSVRLVWRNLDANTFLQVNEMRLVSLGGPDADGNGVADWLDVRLARLSLFDAPQSSPVSPVCLEGESEFVAQLSVQASYSPEGGSNQVAAVRRGTGNGWYADMFLSPTNATTVQVSEMAGGVAYTGVVSWEESDLFAAAPPAVLREGDTLMLNAVAGGAGTGTIDVVFQDAVLTTLVVTASSPAPFAFEAGGEYRLDAVCDETGSSMTTSRVVSVLGGGFAGNPACVVGRTRRWDCPDLPEEAVIEHDERLVVSGQPVEGSGWTFNLRNDYDADYRMVARVTEGGAILATARIEAIAGTHDTEWEYVAVYPDGSRLVEVTLRLGHVPNDLEVRLEIFVVGVIFEDGTLTMVLTAEDFDELGRCTYRFIQSSSSRTSVCHRTKLYQDGQYIGGN